MLSCLPLFIGIRAQKYLGVGLINLKLPGFLACLGKRRIIELLLHKQIRINRRTMFYLQILCEKAQKRRISCTF